MARLRGVAALGPGAGEQGGDAHAHGVGAWGRRRGEGGPALAVGEGPAADDGVVDEQLEQRGGVVAQAGVEVGEAEPVEPNDTSAGRSANRRVEIIASE